MELHESIRGFAVTACRTLPEMDAKLWEMEHTKCGARLVWLDRANDNKTFGIAFHTLPEDDTGVFHILEHSVLCGSERYPAKEPFVELKKSSMNTFLNAMTFPDKTFYPVSSRNLKDFVNLMRVYVDAVFHPLIYSRPEIFWQEGWHYELDDNGGIPVYKGVVFNEMKGALASPDALMRNEMFRQLFPDTCYRCESGGNPRHIPDLTHEKFLENHRHFYHPANSYIFLDGRLDIAAIHDILDSEYLSAYTCRNSQPQLIIQPAVKAEPVRAYYEISPSEAAENKARLAWGFVLGDYRCREEQMAVQALADVLCGSNKAPLTRCILSAGLAQDVRFNLMDGIQQPFVMLELRNLDENRMDEAKSLVFGELRRIAEQRLDHDRLAATLANMEFFFRERSGGMPYGVDFGISILNSWLYGGDPAANLEVGSLFASLNRKLEEGWFETLLERVFLNNDHACQVLLLPSTTLGEERREEEAARLRAAKAGWNNEEETALRARQKRLIAWQTSEDTPEVLATIPSLQLSDIAEKPEYLPIQLDTIRDIPLLRHDVATNGISYVNLYFDITDLTQEELSLASLLTSLLGRLDTDRYSSLDLQRLCRLDTGSVSFSLEPYGQVNRPENGRIYICASYSAVEAKLEAATNLVTEIMLGTRFDDTHRIELLLRQYKAQSEQSIVASGSDYAIARISAGYSIEGVVRECCGGITYFQWLKVLEKDFADYAVRLQTDLERLRKRIFTSGRLTVSVTGAAGRVDDALGNVLLDRLPVSARQTLACAVKPWGRKKEGIVIPADVSFAALGGNLLRYGVSYSGNTQVMSKIISLTYLWNVIRVQGGAYGTGMSQRQTGNVYLYSFRDPSAAHSLGCYQRAADFLEQFCVDGVDLTGFITGAVADTEPLLMPRQQGKVSDDWYLTGLTYDAQCQIRREMLSATPKQLAALADPLRRLLTTGSICVVGSRRQLENCGEKLDTLITL